MTKLTFSAALKSDKALIKRYYREQRYSASFKGLDVCFLASSDDTIICSVIFSRINVLNHQYLMHGLVTRNSHLKQGVAPQLIEYSINNLNNADSDVTFDVFCFIEPRLKTFYEKLGFKEAYKDELSPELSSRYTAYRKNNNDLIIYKFTF